MSHRRSEGFAFLLFRRWTWHRDGASGPICNWRRGLHVPSDSQSYPMVGTTVIYSSTRYKSPEYCVHLSFLEFSNSIIPSEWASEWKLLSRVWVFVIPRTIQFMEFSRPEYWSGQTFSSPGDLPNPEIEPRSPALQADSLPGNHCSSFMKKILRPRQILLSLDSSPVQKK